MLCPLVSESLHLRLQVVKLSLAYRVSFQEGCGLVVSGGYSQQLNVEHDVTEVGGDLHGIKLAASRRSHWEGRDAADVRCGIGRHETPSFHDTRPPPTSRMDGRSAGWRSRRIRPLVVR